MQCPLYVHGPSCCAYMQQSARRVMPSVGLTASLPLLCFLHHRTLCSAPPLSPGSWHETTYFQHQHQRQQLLQLPSAIRLAFLHSFSYLQTTHNKSYFYTLPTLFIFKSLISLILDGGLLAYLMGRALESFLVFRSIEFNIFGTLNEQGKILVVLLQRILGNSNSGKQTLRPIMTLRFRNSIWRRNPSCPRVEQSATILGQGFS